MKKNLQLKLISTISFVGVLIVNALAIFLPLNGLSTKQVSDLYPNFFTPAGITFSIWSIIYLLLAGFVVLMWQRRNSLLIKRILPAFILSCVLNIGWLLAWHFLLPVLSVIIMLSLLTSLIRIFLIIQKDSSFDKLEALLVVMTFRIYLAWICVATIANLAALLVHWNLSSTESTQELWTIVMMAIASFLAIFFLRRFRSWSFAIVVLWALFGICLRWGSGEHPEIVFSGILLMIAVVSLLAYTLFRLQRMYPQRDLKK